MQTTARRSLWQRLRAWIEPRIACARVLGMTEARARERLIERVRALPYRNPFLRALNEDRAADRAHNELRFRALAEIGDFNRAHPEDPIRPDEIGDGPPIALPVPIAALPEPPRGVAHFT
jgi:hypothetical protein